MAIDLKISLDTCDCNNLTFYELTDGYTTINPTGWGTPNAGLNTTLSATLQITTPSGSNFNFNLFPNNFPTNSTIYPYNIPYTSLGLSSGLIDGIYNATYIVTYQIGDNPIVTLMVTNNFLITCNLECCIYTMLVDIDDFKCDCNKDKINNYLTTLALFNSIEKSKNCGDITTAVNDLQLANKLCKNLNCLSCKDNHR